MSARHIRRLAPADAAAYRALMLEAYADAADAFTSTAGERAGAPLAWWAERLEAASGAREAFGAFVDDALVGAVAIEFAQAPKTRHAAAIKGLYVRPGQRRAGTAAALRDAALAAARARPGLRVVRLTVTEGNVPARRLYDAAGFEGWGTEPEAIRGEAGFLGKVHMALRLG
jgi:RimJ/RimL family protein N-acetyltransferase